MIAAPPGWGPWTRRTWISSIVSYSVALPLGAIIVATLLYLAGRSIGHLPLVGVGAVALASAAVGSTRLVDRLSTSRWQIPRSWARFGHTAYAALFGGILGLGVITVTPSIGFYTLVAWALAAQWHDVWPVFLAFGGVRALPLLFVAVRAQRRRENPNLLLERFRIVPVLALPVEIVLLAAIGLLLIATAGL